jgi:hypothetical protein
MNNPLCWLFIAAMTVGLLIFFIEFERIDRKDARMRKKYFKK